MPASPPDLADTLLEEIDIPDVPHSAGQLSSFEVSATTSALSEILTLEKP